MAEQTEVLCFRLPAGQAALLKREAQRKSIPPAEYMRRAVVRQLRRTALADAAQSATQTGL